MTNPAKRGVRSDRVVVFRRLLPFLVKRQHGLLAALVPLLAISIAMQLFRPWPMKAVLDGIFFGAELAWVPSDLLAPEHRTTFLVVACASIVLAAVVDGVASYFLLILSATAGQKAVQRVRSAVVDRIQAMDLLDHRRRSSGDLVMRVTGDVGMLRELLLNGGLEIARNALVLVGMVVVMALLDWRLTAVALAVIPPLWLLTRVVNPAIRVAVKKQREKEGELATDVSEAISAIPVVQAFGLEARARQAIKRVNRSSGRAGLKAKRLEASLGRSAEIVLAGGVAAVLGYGAHRAMAGVLTPGDLVLFASYVRGLYKPLRSVAARSARIAKASACAQRVVEILDVEPSVRDRADAVEAPRLRGELQFDDLSFSYHADEPVLRGVDARVRPGELIALVGRSGAGKTTLAMHLPRLIDPRGGALRVDGRDVREYTLASLRRQVGLVLQDTVLLRGTIAENIAIARPDASAEEIRSAARAAGCDAFIEEFRHGYDTVVGERGATLSGGQARRIAIARVLLKDAPIVVLDEPLEGLDALSEATVRANLRRILQGRTVLLIAHRFSMLPEADRILVLDEGRVAEEGTHDELLTRRGLYRRLHDARGAHGEIPDHVEDPAMGALR